MKSEAGKVGRLIALITLCGACATLGLVLAARAALACGEGGGLNFDPPNWGHLSNAADLKAGAIGGNGVYFEEGNEAFAFPLPQMPDGSTLFPDLTLTYDSGNTSTEGGTGKGWELTGIPRLFDHSDTEIHATVDASSTMEFFKEGNDWVQKEDGIAVASDYELTVPESGSITLENLVTGNLYTFNALNGGDQEGLAVYQENRSGDSVSYAYSGYKGRTLNSIHDNWGRSITFSSGTISYSTPFAQCLKVERTYDGSSRLRKINIRQDLNGDAQWTSQVHYFWYDANHLLKYYVAPKEYDGLPANPTEAQVSALASRKFTYDGSRRVTQEMIGCSGCGGGGSTEGVDYTHTTVNENPANLNTAYRRVEHFYPDDGAQDPSIATEVNELGQLLTQQVKADQSADVKEKRTYTSDGKLEYVYLYDASDLQTPLHVTKFTYDGSGRITKVEISETGASWKKQVEYAYEDGNFPDLPTTVKRFENDDGTGALQTDYEYYASGNGKGLVKKITHPQVNHNCDEAGGSAYRATVEYTYDSMDRISTVTDEDGMVTKYLYADDDDVDNNGNSTIDELPEWSGQLVKVIKDYGEGKLNLTVVEYGYDNNNEHLTVVKDALGNETTYGYNDRGDVTSVTYPGGLYVAYTFDKNGNKTQETKKTGAQGTVLAKTTWAYDGWGRVSEERRFFGSGDNDYGKTFYAYDNLGRVERTESYKDQARGFAAVQETTYVEMTSMPKQLKSGSTDGVTDTLVTTMSYEYDVQGRMTEQTDEVNEVTTTYAYDWRGRGTSVTGPEGYYVASIYDNLDRVAERKRHDTSAQGTLLEHSKTYYDEMGRVYKSEIINPGDTETAETNSYCSKGGKLKKATDPYSKSTAYTYDGAGRQTKVTDALGNETVMAYYADGKAKYTQRRNKIADQTYVTYSSGMWYDSDGRLTDGAEYGTGNLPDPWPGSAPASSDSVHVTSSEYDKLGRTTKVTDPEGMETTYAYDMLSRKAEEIQDAAQGGLAIKVTWQYDEWDGGDEVYYDVVEAWEDAQNHQDTAYYYGAAKHPNAVTKTAYPDSDDVTVAYNDDGTVNTRTDQRDWTVTYTYDDARRVTQESVSGNGLVGTSAVTYAYDALGRPTSVTDNNDPNDADDNSTVEWTYTRAADGDLTVEESQEYGTYTDRTVTVTYDLSGRGKSLAYPSGLTLTYTHDDIGRVTAVNDGSDDRVADTYKGWLLERREYASGAYLTHLDDQGENLSGYGYDTFGRIKNHRWKASGGTLLAGWSHDYDRIGNKKYQEDLQSATQSELYGYDDVYRVTDFKRGQLNEQKTDITSPSRTQTWTLDPLGNWDDTVLDSVTESRTHNTVNELTARTIGEDPQISLSYDAAGNLTQDGDSNGDHKYAWDYRNRLIEVEEKQSGNWNTTGEYKHDARNRRVLKTVTNKGGLNGTTRFIWGGDSDWQCLEERDGSGDLVARFTYAPGYIDAVAVQERDLNSDDDFSDTNEVVYYHQGALATVYAVSGGNESVIERYRYDAYGACTVLDADGSADADGLSDVGNPYTFTGRRLDAESGLMQYRNRYYHTGLGRFISRDPAKKREGDGLYWYVSDSPGLRLDPMGLESLTGVWERYPRAELIHYGRHWLTLPDASRLVIEWGQWYDEDVHCPHCAHGEARARVVSGPVTGPECEDVLGGPTGCAGEDCTMPAPPPGDVHLFGAPSRAAHEHGPLEVADPEKVAECCPDLLRAVEVVNSVINGGGSCQIFFDAGSPPDAGWGPFTVTLEPGWKWTCLWGGSGFTLPELRRIGICPGYCQEATPAGIAETLIHELAHHYGLGCGGMLNPFGEWYAEWAQSECKDEIWEALTRQ